MDISLFKCGCIGSTSSSRADALDQFAAMRNSCPALREILVPDDVWPSFREAHASAPEGVPHASLVFLAFQEGYLGAITGPIHRFLLDEDGRPRNIDLNYLADLRELWMLRDDEVRRHEKGRGYRGKLTELQLADTLRADGWSVQGLAALGEQIDVSAIDARGGEHYIEVKFVGQETEDFKSNAAALRNEGGDIWLDMPASHNYLTTRAFEGARQLKRAGVPPKRVVCLAIGSRPWRYLSELVHGVREINWQAPELMECHEKSSWHEHFDALRGDMPEIVDSLSETILAANELWIYSIGNRFEFVRERAVELLSPN